MSWFRTMMKTFSLCLPALLLAVPVSAQYTNITPATQTNVRAADEFATRAFQDPWDMSQRTDVGWWIFSNDFPRANWVNPTFAGGVFSGTTGPAADGAANMFLLESGIVPTPGGTATPIGKTGQQYPINAGKYTHLIYKMSSSTGFQDTGDPDNVSQFIWSTSTYYEDQTLGVNKPVIQGKAIYDVDLRTLTTIGLLGTKADWNGTKRVLKFLPNAQPGTAITVDWVRLVDGSDQTLFRTLTWTGGAADVYLDNDNNPSNGTLGRFAINASSGVSLFVGGLEAGDYYVALRPPTADRLEQTTGFNYSAGFFRVSSIPTLTFTTPSVEGSSEDFATTRLGNPWDFNSLTDIDFKANIHGDGITQLPLTDLAGNNLGTQTVYLGLSDPATAQSGHVGDPFLFPLFWDGRGKVTRIDPTRYRILTVEHGIPDRARDLNLGSVARVVWRAVNEPTRGVDGLPGQTVGAAYFFNHKAGENTVFKTVIDMKDMPAEPIPFSIGQSTWLSSTAAAGIEAFRFDPHEFDSPTAFFMKRIKLAALERSVSDVLTFRWTYSKPSGTVSLFRQPAGTARDFTTNAAPIVPSTNAATGSYAWSTVGVPDGEYQVYAVFSDGTNSNQVYAPTNIVVDHSNVEVATINLSRTQLNFATFGPVRTQAQIIRLTFSGSGSQCWTTTTSIAGIAISPSSGTGAAAISISATGNFAGGTTTGLINIQSCTNPSNSRAIAIAVTSLNSTSAPSGQMDTPAEGATVSGSVAVTGWATDDVEVVTVRICRDPVGETTTPTQCGGQNKVYIGDAIFIDDARSDIETGNPTTPLNYRAGWGYLMLTNFLPNGGNGPVTLHAYAIDREGNVSLIGSKSIITNNFAATKPFGAIDTPGQGQAVCGTIINFGWALTQAGKDIPADSSTISVFVDDVFVGRPGARLAREDITAAFPALDTSHAVGGFVLDTTTLANGVHTIYWIVSDNTGANDGIGSRFFTVSNPCTGG